MAQTAGEADTQTLTICCVTPSDRCVDESKGTLQFAARAKSIQTSARVNEVLDDQVQLKRRRDTVLPHKVNQIRFESPNPQPHKRPLVCGSGGAGSLLEAFGEADDEETSKDEEVTFLREINQEHQQERDALRQKISELEAKLAEYCNINNLIG